ncbi:hypothetical protein ANCCAN_24620 [Ancylostoma caninum]|uniref:Uncharacterized protein n=1 Tax=Ancylostoma caninum TaxID=29170 RepID=A0A368FHG3_ANCCA|nr:hypothetical protein ANCCAN_24620 [Ancylostoma caninum]
MESNAKTALQLGIKLNNFLIVPILALVVSLFATFIAIVIIMWIYPHYWLEFSFHPPTIYDIPGDQNNGQLGSNLMVS